ncbi:MAG: hypothetical protein JRJ49_05990 [Deltaproteobacteria bacterium]|nr:hypothetical protein [Deltaproteobacteria bacterium]
MGVHAADKIESLEFREGLTIFIRNISLLSFILPIIYLFFGQRVPNDLLCLFITIYPWFIIFALFMIVFSSFVDFYYDLSVLSMIYIFCKKKKCSDEIKGDIEKIVVFFISLNRNDN